jgi:hypothetical protein
MDAAMPSLLQRSGGDEGVSVVECCADYVVVLVLGASSTPRDLVSYFISEAKNEKDFIFSTFIKSISILDNGYYYYYYYYYFYSCQLRFCVVRFPQ